MNNSTSQSIQFAGHSTMMRWDGPGESVVYDTEGLIKVLSSNTTPCFAVQINGKIGLTTQGTITGSNHGNAELLAYVPPVAPEQLGDQTFREFYGIRMAVTAGAMANGIASEDMVIALGKAGLMGSFGAAGLVPVRLESAIDRIKSELPVGAYAFNLIHSPSEEALERRAVDLYLKHSIRIIEASAFLDLTPNVVRYRVSGLSAGEDGAVAIGHKVIAKVSRREVATKFMQPAPFRILHELVQTGAITDLQARLAERVPMADDITVEADSGGHTDNRPLVCVIPSMIALRDEIQEEYGYAVPVRIGAAGGIGTPEAVLAAFMMGASYIVTGSINQSCLESGSSTHTKQLLAQAEMADVVMAPAADMFEMGVKVQLLKRGTLFPMRAQKLYDLYKMYESIDDIPIPEREKLEKQVFRRPLEDIWNDTVAYFTERDPEQVERATSNPKRKMALIFRWYLGLSSRWSNSGEKGRESDYQIWCGPAMGAFNDWVRGSFLEHTENRHVADVALQLMIGAAYLYRVQALYTQGVQLGANLRSYMPRVLS